MVILSSIRVSVIACLAAQDTCGCDRESRADIVAVSSRGFLRADNLASGDRVGARLKEVQILEPQV
ncbi:MAG: hypothetical protein QHH06_08420 [Clostridiales bacterium]|nr:hypothetical protein [Eubacteriales bacterium]MDH7566492.1 hypothetical protein [Clostridiales bacterium]